MTQANGVAGAGRLLAEQLWLVVVRTEGNDLRCNCPFCSSHDSFGIDRDTGVWHCFACGRGGSAWDLTLAITDSKEQAKNVMIVAGLFEADWKPPDAPQPPPAAGDTPQQQPEQVDAVATWATRKGVTADAFRAYGGRPLKTDPKAVKFPMWDVNGNGVSAYVLDVTHPKGIYAKGKPWGIFFPGTRPAPGEKWLVVEGVKDAAALWAIGYQHTAGLPGSFLKAEFAPLFAGCEVVIIPDRDNAGDAGSVKSAAALAGHTTTTRLAILPAEHRDSDGEDVRDCLKKKNGESSVKHCIEHAKRVDSNGKLAKDIEYRWISCEGLDTGDFRIEFLVDNVLVRGQPCVIGGPSKALKTSLVVDLGISLAKSHKFLGHWWVKQPVNVGIMTGESGMATLQSTARRVCESKGLQLRDIDRLWWSEDVPRFDSVDHLEAVRHAIEALSLDVAIIDPLYLALPGANTASLNEMGELLRSVNTVCTETGCTLILVHHTTKHYGLMAGRDKHAPLEREDLHGAGMAEWPRQWLLVNRREEYRHDGDHALHLTVGGSAGHSGHYALDISEGRFDSATMSLEKWDVSVSAGIDIRKEQQETKESEKIQADLDKITEKKQKILSVLNKHPGGLARSKLQRTSGVDYKYFDQPFSELLEDFTIEPCEITVSNKKTPITGYRIADNQLA